jgi:Zn finger protein HypA/HybF involved in hydrogenase expression
MHERAVVADLIRKAVEVAVEEGASRVTRMTVRVGGLSHVDPAALAAQVEQAATGTPVEGAAVEVAMSDGDPLADPHADQVRLVSVEVGASDGRRAPGAG